VITLIGMDNAGRYTGSKILKHSEPILLLGIPEGELTRFTRQYLGKHVTDKLDIGKSSGSVGLDGITGATVTVIAQNQVMMKSAMNVARQVGIVKSQPKPAARFLDPAGKSDWARLADEGAVQHLTVSRAQVGLPDAPQPYLDLWFGYLNQPTVGRAVLGESGYQSLMARLAPNEHALFIVNNGSESFKGSGFVRGGIYDRIQVQQDLDSYTFRDLDYLNLYDIAAPGAPAFHESGIFIVRHAPGFSAAYPWQLVFLGNKIDQQTGQKTFAAFEREYWLPARYLQGGRPHVERPDPTWLKVWKDRAGEIAAFVVFLLAVSLTYALRDKLVRRSSRKDKRWVNIPKYSAWAISVGFVGFGAMAQPSVTQVLTWVHALVGEWRWELFLSDPLIFVFWWFILISVVLWGRGLFCGWLCPFGSLTEGLYKIVGATPLKRFQKKPNARLHARLKWLKYGVFAGLLGVSLYSMTLAEQLAEVEPFKTTFLVGVLHRSWPFVLFWSLIIGVSLFVERPFCKYLCPLGASLAIPSRFRLFGLKRKAECGPCAACAVGCGSLAIDDKGRIDQKECLLCLDCMVMYYDDHACPPLAQERKRRVKSGQALTPIGKDGYFIPITPLPAEPKPARPQPNKETV
jgi:NosR/NirI family nitrous oxide reductase transcriptional regulator